MFTAARNRPISQACISLAVGSLALRPAVGHAGCRSGLDCIDLVFGSPFPGLVPVLLGVGLLSAFAVAVPPTASGTRRACAAGFGAATLVLLAFWLELPFALRAQGVPLPIAGWGLCAFAVASAATIAADALPEKRKKKPATGGEQNGAGRN